MNLANATGAMDDRRTLQTLAAVIGELATDATPEGWDRQSEALRVALEELHFTTASLDNLPEGDEASAAAAARDLLAALANHSDTREVVEEWTRRPPGQEAAAVSEELTNPVVITGCLILLEVVGHVKFEYQTGKGWRVQYDPARRGQLDALLQQVVGVLDRLMRRQRAFPGEQLANDLRTQPDDESV